MNACKTQLTHSADADATVESRRVGGVYTIRN